MLKITSEMLSKAMNYEAYMQLFEKVVAEKRTTGPNQNEHLAHYTELNLHRTRRVIKTFKVPVDVSNQIETLFLQTWILITEAWCGDAAHSLGVIKKMAACNPNIKFQILLRDENLDLIDSFLTKGTRSIPKLILCEGEELNIKGHWGPRPADLQNEFLEMKENGVPKEELQIYEQNWYNADKGKKIMEEIIDILIK
jgi:hypothetical protein